jgi:uncharacterized protein
MLASAIIDNLLAAPVLAFALAFVATLLGSDVKLPSGLYPVLSMYLLLAIGLKGGKGLAESSLADLWQPILAAVVLGLVTPTIAYLPMRAFARLSVVDAAAIAAHYGSVSAVTFTVVLSFLEATGEATEGFLAGLLAILEIIGIVVALAIAHVRGEGSARGEADGRGGWGEALSEVVRGRSIALLLVGLIIGLVAGVERLQPVDPLFVGLFAGMLTLFLLDMGTVAAQRLREVREAGWRLVLLALLVPVVNGALGALAGAVVGLSTGGTTVLATLAASASYIAAPAAVRIALPAAKPGLYITSSLGITFPFNIIFGVPLYYAMAQALT